jgi:hypothetical protein
MRRSATSFNERKEVFTLVEGSKISKVIKIIPVMTSCNKIISSMNQVKKIYFFKEDLDNCLRGIKTIKKTPCIY